MPTNLPSEPDRLQSITEANEHLSSASYRADAEPIPLGGSGGLDLRRYLAALARYKWLVLGIMILGTAGGIVASRLFQPQYSAHATIWIETSQPGQSSGQGPIQSGQLLHSFAWLDLLKSYTVLDSVVLEQRLYLSVHSPADSAVMADFGVSDPVRPGFYRLTVDKDGKRWTLADTDGTKSVQGVVGQPIGEELGFNWTPPAKELVPGRTVEFSVRYPREAARQLAEQLDPKMVQNGNFLRLELTGTNPERITATVNAVADRYVKVAAELKSVKVNELVAILDEQLRYAEESLRESEIELESFRVSTITLPTERATPVAPGLLETRDPVMSNFFEMKIEQEQLRRDREALERAMAQGRGPELSVAAFEFIGSVRNSDELMTALQELTRKRTELRALQAQYTDEHPTIRRLRDDIVVLEERAIPHLVWSLMRQISAREAQIESNVRNAASELQQIPPRQLEEARLTRQVEIAANLYTTLRQRHEAARLAAVSSIPDIRILDRATIPTSPFEDQRPRVIFVAFMGSLGLALLGAILLDRFDPRLRYPEQVTEGLRLSILGAIPYIKNRHGRLREDNTAHVIEAFRELRLSITHAYGAAGPLIVTITSPGSGDGKSFISANLALSFADQGHRTLLIDGDIRRGAQHRHFGGTRKPGLMDYLTGRASIDQIIQETSYPSLHLLPCGMRLQGGPELLGSPAMAELMRDLRSRYSVIIVDSPPLGAGVDPFILGTLTGNMMLVMRTGLTDREFAEMKLNLLDRLPVRILGAVLNAIPPQGTYRYYVYLPGYESQDEGMGLAVRELPGL